MPSFVVLWALGASLAAAGMTAVAASIGLRLRQVRASAEQLEAAQRALREELAETTQAAEVARRRSTELDDALVHRDHDLRLRTEEVRTERREGQEARRVNASLREELDEARNQAKHHVRRIEELEQRFREAQQGRRHAEQQHSALSKEAAGLDRRVRQAEYLLAELRVSPGLHGKDPLAEAVRPESRQVLRSLTQEGTARAAALVRRDGLALLAAGPTDVVERLASQAALIDGLVGPASGLLCATVRGISLVDGRGGAHFEAMPQAGLWLALANDGDAPTTTLRLASLALRGTLPVQWAVPPLEAPVDLTSDAELERVLRGWAARWSVEQAAVLTADGGVVAITEPAFSGGLVAVHQALIPLYLRMARDGWPISTLTVEARTDAGSLSVHALNNAVNSPVVVAFGAHLPGHAAMEELSATCRWQLAAQPERQAS